ncbi:phage shock protein C (PspC) family protein [Novosphingobium sp. PhB165]|uniref:PspC domain-containing protein n=1 Tax=Novosphingobium sp. PhB165 TaxID=2485105 RepID=UPI001044A51C|nr:PspC domain-containing protein [Novosphingobium sp. PhB165]TCM17912.1 phage shock protein C (PspC) family protein [Novosphingobium sp. PhB165]
MSRGHFYIDKSNAKVAGVCSGIAEYTGVDTFWVRLGAVLLTLFGFYLTIPIYIALALLADKKPMYLYSDEEEERLLRRMERRRVRQSRGLDRGLSLGGGRSSRLRSDISDIDRRVAEMEEHYAGTNARLAAEIDSLR